MRLLGVAEAEQAARLAEVAEYVANQAEPAPFEGKKPTAGFGSARRAWDAWEARWNRAFHSEADRLMVEAGLRRVVAREPMDLA